MSEASNSEKAMRPAPGAERWLWLELAVVVLAMAGVLYGIGAAAFKHPGENGLKSLAVGDMAKLEVSAKPTRAPDTAITGPDGRPLRLADLRGKVLVVNFWATWCAPCVAEMPTLAKLQARYKDRPLQVVAVSLDRPEDEPDAKAFIAARPPLTFYHDPKYALAFALDPRPAGLPTTVLYDRQGLERARMSGGADWSSPQAQAVMDRLLAPRD